MSRSYKRTSVVKDSGSKFSKRMASKSVRRASDIPKGCGYRKLFCSWNICDWRFFETFYSTKEFRRRWFDKSDEEFDAWRRFRNWKEAYRYWLRGHRMK
ncbi:MAG: hypothetical protein NC299_07070 [Lachnospiraceae bacterium]|nr:hypothetical protein [Ruminococcus sp.]MCM1275115.1 hypothetical protein [Lachnospiraceae bacterium]